MIGKHDELSGFLQMVKHTLVPGEALVEGQGGKCAAGHWCKFMEFSRAIQFRILLD
jgi:hypothetical protein